MAIVFRHTHCLGWWVGGWVMGWERGGGGGDKKSIFTFGPRTRELRRWWMDGEGGVEGEIDFIR